MPVIPLGYPLDLTATAATNFIQNEVVTFNTVQEKMFVPSKGPFYTLSMEIRHGVTNALLQPETQYKLLQPVKEAIRMSGKEVCAVIYITDNSIPSITISYRVIGGIFSDTASEISDVLLNNPLPPSSQVSWWDILDKPDQFTPSEHLHHVDNIYGMDDVVAVLENIRIAILAGDSVAIGAIYQYINILLSNLEYATENFVNDALSSLDTTKYVRAFNTHAELRDFSSLVNNEPYLYITTGRTAPQDKLGNIFYWDITSVEDDDDRFVLKPNHIPPGNPGRFISPLRDTHEQKKLATSVQRVLNTSTELYEDSLFINQAVVTGDCNNYVKEGKYWVGNHALIANAPFSNCVMEVTNIASLNADPSQGEVLQVFDDGHGRVARRIRQYVSPGVYQWSDLIIKDDTKPVIRTFKTYNDLRAFSDLVNNESYIYLATGKNAVNDQLGNIFMWDASSTEADDDRFVLKPDHVLVANPGRYVSPLRDTHEQKKLATSVQRVLNTATEEYEDSLLINQAVVVGDCNNYIKEGKFWIGTGIANSPFPNCVMEVTNIAALNADPSQGEVLQVFDDGLGKRARRIRQYVSPGVYQWSDLIIKDDAGVEEKFECNIGIVIRYFGQTPVLMPCYIGEEYGIDYVTVKISGEVKTLQLDDIAPVPDLVNGSHDLAYIYLVENPPGTFALARGVKPNFPSTGNMTQERKSMYHPGDNPLTSNRLFVGLAYSDGVRYRLSRSWHQDPGFIENYYNYKDSALLDNPAALGYYYSGKTLPITLYSVLRCFLGVYNSIGAVYFEDDITLGKQLRAIPFISWADEAVIINFHFNAFVLNPEASYAIYLRGFVNTVTLTLTGSGYFGTGTSTRVSNGGYTAPGNETNTYDTVNGSFIVTNKDDCVGEFQIGASGQGGATLKLLPDYSTAATITLTQVHNFRKLYINASDPSIWFGNTRFIVLTGTIFDLNLKTYHDNLYGGPAPAGTTVEFIVSNGCIVSASTTSLYALTNPTGWASGCVVKLTINAGGIVAGRGGNGGRGGRAYIRYPDPDPPHYVNYIGGYLPNPNTVVNGKPGGNAIRVLSSLIISNAGIISVGGGGGGASGGAIARYVSSQGLPPGRAQSGSGGGGGWPFGQGGLPGQIDHDDVLTADYVDYDDVMYYKNHIHQIGNPGVTATANIQSSAGGGGRNNYGNDTFYANTPTAGSGACPPLAIAADPGVGGNYYGETNYSTAGDGGNSGANGTTAINGISLVTLINQGGSIYGGQV